MTKTTQYTCGPSIDRIYPPDPVDGEIQRDGPYALYAAAVEVQPPAVGEVGGCASWLLAA
jgi:hypothetical protein